MLDQLQDIIANPASSAFIVLNLVLLESLLSIDNAAVLATMVKDLPANQKSKALKYGILGAYVFRGLALLFASYLIKIWWLKPIGGLYLLYLTLAYFKKSRLKTDSSDEEEIVEGFFGKFKQKLGGFWYTVALIEIMDLAFSIDNVFAAVAYTKNILLIIFGVFIGILAIRFVAQWFIKIMEKYPFLEPAAFIVIGVLGLKLILSALDHLLPQSTLALWLNGHTADLLFSVMTTLVFIAPVLWHKLFAAKPKN